MIENKKQVLLMMDELVMLHYQIQGLHEILKDYCEFNLDDKNSFNVMLLSKLLLDKDKEVLKNINNLEQYTSKLVLDVY